MARNQPSQPEREIAALADTPPRAPRAGIWITLAALAAMAMALVFIDRDLVEQVDELHEGATLQRAHLHELAQLRRDCAKVQTALLERWLGQLDGRPPEVAKLRTLLERVKFGGTRLSKMRPVNTEEEEARSRLTAVVAEYVDRLRLAIERTEGRDALADLQPIIGRIDTWADRVLEIDIRAGDESDARVRRVQERRVFVQLGLAAAIAAILALGVWWRGRALSEARYLAHVRTQQMRSASLRAEFFANMSHELRTPLVAIGGFASMIDQRPGVEAWTRDTAQRIDRASKDLLSIINNILDVAKLESQHVDLLIERVSIEDVLQRCVWRCEGLLAGRPLGLELDVAAALPAIRGDFVKLQQVFTNLIANAIKFTEHGKVTVSARQGEPGWVTVQVVDTGVGIAPQALKTIWERFRQADHKVARRFGGSGLGLAIVRGVVDRLGGTVEVESTVGIGSTFTVKLPEHREEPSPTSRA